MPFFTVSVSRRAADPTRVHADAHAVWYDAAGHREKALASVDVEIPRGRPEAVLGAALEALAAALAGVGAD